MDKKKIIIVALVVVAVAAIAAVQIFIRSHEELETTDGYIFDKSLDVKFEDVKNSRGVVRQDLAEAQAVANTRTGGPIRLSREQIRKYFEEDQAGVNPYTLKYFKHLEKMFSKSTDLASHLEDVKKFLYENLPPDEAARYFELYEKYLTTEMALAEEKKNWGWPKTPEEVIAMLRRVQDFRREHMGAEMADALFGADVKTREYAIRRGAIVSNEELYGAEKEKLLKTVTEEMWGEDAEAVENFPKPYNRYREKLEIYERDLAELPEGEERDQKVREFREEFFEPEIVQELEKVDQQIQAEQQAEDYFRETEQAILEDDRLSADEKQQKIDSMIDDTFGQEADAFRRREVMRKELERRKEEHRNRE